MRAWYYATEWEKLFATEWRKLFATEWKTIYLQLRDRKYMY